MHCIKKGTFTVSKSKGMKHFNAKYPHALLICLKSLDAEPEFEISGHKPLRELTEL